MKCSKHETYKGVYPPRTNCKDCRMVYTKNQLKRLTIKEIASNLSLTKNTILNYLKQMNIEEGISPELEAHQEAVFNEKSKQVSREKKKSRAKDNRISELEEELDAVLGLNDYVKSYKIKPNGSYENEATAVVMVSDWHIEEVVKSGQVSGSNEFNKEICQERITRFWRHTVKLLKKEQKATNINTMVIALLGDFISGTIHEDLAETNRLLPADAIIEAENHLISGIRYVLDNTDVNLIIPCMNGNHGRMSARQRISAESGNSLERYMYHHLAGIFKGEKRVKFIIPEGYFVYLDVYDYVIRIHHGHYVRYGGGVGGLSIPLNKAIAQWDKQRRADISIQGHFHQQLDGGNWIVNGSLIGFNAFALSIKADFEPPKQAFFLVDRDNGKTVVAPVILANDK